jgi:hypothetical protein
MREASAIYFHSEPKTAISKLIALGPSATGLGGGGMRFTVTPGAQTSVRPSPVATVCRLSAVAVASNSVFGLPERFALATLRARNARVPSAFVVAMYAPSSFTQE